MYLIDVLPAPSTLMFIGFFGLLGLNAFMSRAALRRNQAAAKAKVLGFRGYTSDGTLFVDATAAEVLSGPEEYEYGLLTVVRYSRRFLIKYENRHFLAIASTDRNAPYVRALDAERGELVAGFKEWSNSSVA
jgi:hypothetical protein